MYSIQIEKNAEDFLKKLQRKDAEVILNKIYSIRENPFRYLNTNTDLNMVDDKWCFHLFKMQLKNLT